MESSSSCEGAKHRPCRADSFFNPRPKVIPCYSTLLDIRNANMTGLEGMQWTLDTKESDFRHLLYTKQEVFACLGGGGGASFCQN